MTPAPDYANHAHVHRPPQVGGGGEAPDRGQGPGHIDAGAAGSTEPSGGARREVGRQLAQFDDFAVVCDVTMPMSTALRRLMAAEAPPTEAGDRIHGCRCGGINCALGWYAPWGGAPARSIRRFCCLPPLPPLPSQRNTKGSIDYMFGVIHKQLVLRICLEENHHGTWSSGHLSRIIICARVLRRERRRTTRRTRGATTRNHHHLGTGGQNERGAADSKAQWFWRPRGSK